MARLLIVHHTVSPATQELYEEVLGGAHTDGIEGVEVVSRPALSATAYDVLAADGIVLGTTANIGYMSGALKYFFDQIYYPCLGAKPGLPYGFWVHGNDDVQGAVRPIETFASALGWRKVAWPVTVIGAPTGDDRENCWNLGAGVAATLSD